MAANDKHVIFDLDDVSQEDAEEVLGELRAIGAEIDDEFGLVPISADLTHFIARGAISAEAAERLRESDIPVQVFADGKITLA